MSSRELAAAPVALPRPPWDGMSTPLPVCRNHHQSQAVRGSPGAPAPLEGPAGQCPGSLGRCPHEQAARGSRSAALLRAEVCWALATFTLPPSVPWSMAPTTHLPGLQGWGQDRRDLPKKKGAGGRRGRCSPRPGNQVGRARSALSCGRASQDTNQKPVRLYTCSPTSQHVTEGSRAPPTDGTDGSRQPAPSPREPPTRPNH